MRLCFFVQESPVGLLRVAERDGAISELRLLPTGETVPCVPPTALLREAARQLSAYFDGQRTAFDLPLRPAGTDFQRRVWSALCEIPYGETRSYSDIARQVGSPKAVRAVGQANHRNPIPILIPCHRVIGKNGKPVGYAYGLAVKAHLLALERAAQSVIH